MSDGMPESSNQYVIPHGFDFQSRSMRIHRRIRQASMPRTPCMPCRSGSMLFDPEFFVMASKRFPHVAFHIIGSGTKAHPGYGENVRVYDEMPHHLTLPYIKHASIGIAPYRSANLPRYLADTSLKLMQYDFFKLPAVCPNSIVGDYASRFGYEPGNSESITTAMNAAMAAPRISSRNPASLVAGGGKNVESHAIRRYAIARGMIFSTAPILSNIVHFIRAHAA